MKKLPGLLFHRSSGRSTVESYPPYRPLRSGVPCHICGSFPLCATGSCRRRSRPEGVGGVEVGGRYLPETWGCRSECLCEERMVHLTINGVTKKNLWETLVTTLNIKFTMYSVTLYLRCCCFFFLLNKKRHF